MRSVLPPKTYKQSLLRQVSWLVLLIPAPSRLFKTVAMQIGSTFPDLQLRGQLPNKTGFPIKPCCCIKKQYSAPKRCKGRKLNGFLMLEDRTWLFYDFSAGGNYLAYGET